MDGREGKASSTSNNFYFFPSVVVYRSVKKWNLNVSYKRELQCPTIVQLNHFFESSTNNFRLVENPDLKCETKDVARLGASYFRKRVSMSLGVTYSRTDDAILKTQTESIDETGVIISSYDNTGEVRTFTGSVFFIQLAARFFAGVEGIYRWRSLSDKDRRGEPVAKGLYVQPLRMD